MLQVFKERVSVNHGFLRCLKRGCYSSGFRVAKVVTIHNNLLKQ